MKTRAIPLLALAAALTLLPAAHAQSRPQSHPTARGKAAQTKTAAAPMYECPICHHRVNAAQAEHLHYVCPVDHGRLALVKTSGLRKPH